MNTMEKAVEHRHRINCIVKGGEIAVKLILSAIAWWLVFGYTYQQATLDRGYEAFGLIEGMIATFAGLLVYWGLTQLLKEDKRNG